MTAHPSTSRLIETKPVDECRYDLVSLGEVMLRLDPGEGRIATTRGFHVWEGGGEYNVARGLRRCFDMRTAVVTALADNAVGRLVEDCILQGGVGADHILWRMYDGVGRSVRNGLNFTERGFGVRGAVGVSDRGHTATSQLSPGDIDWGHIFGTLGARWFHTGGIFAGLSESCAEVVHEAVTAAREHGTIVSYDLNYRPSLWKDFGGLDRAREVNRSLVRNVDVLLGNEEDFTACLGYEVPGVDADFVDLDSAGFRHMINLVTQDYPQLKVVATTLRAVHSASVNDWGAVGWADHAFAEAQTRHGLQILDRVGGGDSFASGLIFGLLSGYSLGTALEYGTAHGALAMTTPGDTSMARLADVEALMGGKGQRVQR
jgi:2-dehydro-3-deoxygluconokinase